MYGERNRRVIEAAAMALLAWQATRALFAMLFARVYDALFDGEAFLTLVIALVLGGVMLLLPLALGGEARRARGAMRGGAVIAALARVAMAPDIPTLRLFAAVLVLGGCGLYVAGLFRLRARVLVTALSLGLFADQALRALGHTYDLSLRGWWLPVQVALSALLVALALRPAGEVEPAYPESRAGGAAGLAGGCAFFLMASLLGLPNAMARWIQAPYGVTVIWALTLALTPLAWRLFSRRGVPAPAPVARWLWSAVLLGGLAGGWYGGPLWGALALAAATVALWRLLPLGLYAGGPRINLGLTAGMAVLLGLGVWQALASNYAYTVSGLRGLGIVAILLAGLGVAGPALVAAAPPLLAGATPGRTLPWVLGSAATLLAVSLVALWPATAPSSAATERLSLGTYNIHYGFDGDWRLSLEGQAETIAASGAQVVALQEVDAGRLTSYGIDTAFWLGRRLGMEAVYLPTVERTTGIAMLSAVPIVGRAGAWLPSALEQTGIIRLDVALGDESVAAYGVWLGLTPEERARQLADALGRVAPGRATFAGDLNATPDSSVYAALQGAGFSDPFVAAGFAPLPTDPAETPEKRIDYVWLRGLTPTAADVVDSTTSDHRMVVVTAALD